jgi:hypothetical protein
MTQLSKIVTTALQGLNPRQKEVLTARFGLESAKGEEETLAAIGDRLKVTRERVRQIEASGISLAKANLAKNAEAMQIIEKVKKYIMGRGGVARKADVVAYAGAMAKGASENQLDFLSEVSRAFNAYREDNDYLPFYYVSEKDLKNAQEFVDGWVNFLKSRKEKVVAGSYETQLASFVKTEAISNAVALSYLGVAKHIQTNPYGDVGLRDWPEIRPMTVRDKIYLVLKKKGEPLHFEDIALSINKVGFDGQEALIPTVHNELIKDNRFVLVGRGMYALREQGFEPGTAREVITKILKSGGPLAPPEVVTQVNKQRYFKPNTILINLQNRNFFERMPDGRYRVRES